MRAPRTDARHAPDEMKRLEASTFCGDQPRDPLKPCGAWRLEFHAAPNGPRDDRSTRQHKSGGENHPGDSARCSRL
jgi:hypothetical protein